MLERELIAPCVQLQFEAWAISTHVHWLSTQDYVSRVSHLMFFIHIKQAISTCMERFSSNTDVVKREEYHKQFVVPFLNKVCNTTLVLH